MQKFILLTATCLALVAQSSFAQDISKAKRYIRNVRVVSESIIAGGNPMSKTQGDQGLEALVELGIATNINLQGGDIDDTIIGWAARFLQKGEFADVIAYEKNYLEARGVAFYNFPLNSHAPKTAEEDIGIRAALKLMGEATPAKPVYIHCEHGADRTGLLIALYRVVYEGWDPQVAYAEWVRNGHTRAARIITGDLDVYYDDFIRAWKQERNESPALARTGSDCGTDLNP